MDGQGEPESGRFLVRDEEQLRALHDDTEKDLKDSFT